MLYIVLAFMLVAVFFNQAQRNIAGRRKGPSRKTYKQALKQWEAFQKKHPPRTSKQDEP